MDNNYFCLNWFYAELESPEGKMVVQKQGPSLTTQGVLKMLRGYEKRLVSESLLLCLGQKILAFKETGQKEPDFTLYERYCNYITFNAEIPTRAVIWDRIKKRYLDYEIKEHDRGSDDVWAVSQIFKEPKSIHLVSGDITVLNPKTFEQVYPKPQNNQGKVSPVFDKYLTPINLTAITPGQRNDFLRNCKIR